MATNSQLTWAGDADPDFQPAADQFCAVCCDILRKTEVLDMYVQKHCSKKTEVERWPHQANRACLLESAQQGCHLCSLLYMQSSQFSSDALPSMPSGLLKLQIRYNGDLQCGIEDVGGSMADRGNGLGPTHLSDTAADESMSDKQTRSARRTVSTASDATLALAQAWLRECRSEHQECSERGVFPPQGPRRLLQLSKLNEERAVRLLELSHWTADIEYLTLSHCWGSGVPLKLTQESHEPFLQNIPFDDLPRTFQDAVDITLRLGYRYLWIDALCIIQDNNQDWDTEAQAMGYIYGSSVCTIAALTAPNSHSGCYGWRNPLAYLPCKIQTRRGNVLYLESARSGGLKSVMRPDNMGSFDSPVLHTRGWVVQERVLSPRTLYYSSMGVQWECCRAEVSEHDKAMEKLSRSFATGRLKLGVSQIFRNDSSFEDSWASRGWHEQWWHLVQIYTGCDLTYSRDRWNAISGMASMFSKASGSSLISGLWRDPIGKDLLWETTSPPADRLDNGMPSWSWLSIDAKVRLNGLVVGDFIATKIIAEVLSLPAKRDLTVRQHQLDNPPYGPFITIRAPLMRCRIREPPEDRHLPSPWISSSPLDVEVRNSIELGRWFPDITNMDKTQDIWALHCMNEATGLQGLVIRPFTEEKTSWYRVGQFQVGHDGSVEKKALGEVTTISLY